MNRDGLSGHAHEGGMSRLVDKACHHWEARQQAAARGTAVQQGSVKPSFTIALSRQAGTDGTAVAQEIGNQIGWHVYDHELLERIAHEMGLRTALLDSVDERNQSWLLETAEAFEFSSSQSEAAPFVSESAYVRHLVQTVLALGVHGECVIVGRGASFILPAKTTLRVRLVGTLKDRIAALSRKRGISEQDAARQIRTIDRERTDFVQDHFLKDPTDPENYDLILNAPRLSVSKSAAIIVETLHRLQAVRAEQGGATAQ